MTTRKHKLIVFGEVLWDVFGADKHLGGAPLNFAYYAQRLLPEAEVLVVSALGDDELGRLARAEIVARGIDDRFIAALDAPTGRVDVNMKPDHSHEFVIHENVAWDFIAPQDFTNLTDADLLYFGSLAQRSESNRATLTRLVERNRAALTVFDINLRGHYYTTDVIRRSLSHTKLLKINDDEWATIKPMLSLPDDEDRAVAQLFAQFPVESLCVTKGENGAELLTAGGKRFVTPGRKVDVVDTVGCGDSFAAALAASLLFGDNPQAALDRAAELAARVAQTRGALLDR